MSSRSTQIVGGPDREHAYVDGATNALLVKLVNGGSGTVVQYNEDSAHTTGDTGTMALVVRNDAGGSMVSADGDYAPLQVDSTGALRVTGGGGGVQYQEDAPHTTGDTGTMALVVRQDTPGSLVGTNGDYAPLQVDSTGRLRVAIDAAVALPISGTVAVTQSGAWSVGVNNFPVVQSVNDNGGSLTVDQPTHDNLNLNANLQVGDADVGVGNPVPVSGTVSTTLGGLVSTGNSTTTPLGSNATFTGTWEDISDYATLSVTVYSDVVSATDGLKLEWSGNGVTADEIEAVSTSASKLGRAMAFNARARYFRIVYINGATAQTTFRLSTVYRPAGSGTNNHKITEVLEDTTLAIITRSVIAGQTTGGGGGGYHNVKVTPSGALTVEVDDGGGSITVDGTVTALQGTSPWVIGDGGGSITVDGAVAATQSGAWTVGVNNFPAVYPVNDNGGSLTVDGTVAVTQSTSPWVVSGTVAATQSGAWTVAATQSGAWSVTAAQATHDSLNANVNLQVGDVDVGSANPVPISDAGGSLTVDGTVAATQSGAWTVAVSQPVSVDDNGGSLTVDGTVAATQSGAWSVTAAQATHDSLNANVNLQVGDTDVGSANPVPISDAGGSITVDGTVAVSSIAGSVTIAEPVSVDDNGGSLTVDDGGLSLTVDGTVAVSGVSGSVTVAQATHDSLNANANMQIGDADVGSLNPVPISDNGGSLTVDGTVAATQSGAWTVSVNQPVSIDDNGGSLTVDGTVAATQSGAWAVSVNAVAPGTSASSLGKAEDAVHSSGDVGVMSLSVRKDVSAALAGTDGDYAPLLTGADGRLHARSIIRGATDALDMDIVESGATSFPGPNGLVPIFEVTDSPAFTKENDWFHGSLDSGTGGLRVQVVGSTGTVTIGGDKVEDSAHTNGATGVFMLAVRNDAGTSMVTADGDYAPFQVNSRGALYVKEAGVTTVVLSGSTRGRPIQITGTTSGGATTLHTATTTSGQLDRVYVYLTNTSTSAVTVTIEFGTTGAGNEIDIIVPANETVLAVDGAVLGGAATDTIKAYATTASSVNAFGRVERLL